MLTTNQLTAAGKAMEAYVERFINDMRNRGYNRISDEPVVVAAQLLVRAMAEGLHAAAKAAKQQQPREGALSPDRVRLAGSAGVDRQGKMK